MARITKKEIEIFGKILSQIGDKIQKNPDILIDILMKDEKIKEKKLVLEISEKVKNINIFDVYKNKKKSEIVDDLEKLNKDELRYIIKSFNLGVCRSTSVSGLAEFIADQIVKRTTDVFINQE